jgi:3-phenylpropionate/trans-cinnamate dioxygenase ferredoxin subunit
MPATVRSVRLGPADEVALGSLRRYEVGSLAICVARLADGAFYALEDRCTHDDVELSDGDLVGSDVECPAHGSLFDVATGEVCGLPATVPARVYALRVDGDDLVLEL